MNSVSSPDEITLAIIQSELAWENPQANLPYFEEQISSINDEVHLVVLPETFSTGFTMNVEEHADRTAETLAWMVQMAADHHMVIAGSVIVYEANRYYNRLYWVHPEGNVETYDKRHLFRMGREEEFFTPGTERVVARLGDARILLQICYDLRFPVFARNRGDYDVILYVANWPSKREHVWNTLLPARAIENQALVIAANRTGTDGLGEGTCGGSCVIDPRGHIKTRLDDRPGVLLSTFRLSEIRSFREDFPSYRDADDFELRLSSQ